MSTLPLAVASKLTQVMELYRIKTQGDVSKLTWSLAAYGCAGEKLKKKWAACLHLMLTLFNYSKTIHNNSGGKGCAR